MNFLFQYHFNKSEGEKLIQKRSCRLQSGKYSTRSCGASEAAALWRELLSNKGKRFTKANSFKEAFLKNRSIESTEQFESARSFPAEKYCSGCHSG